MDAWGRIPRVGGAGGASSGSWEEIDNHTVTGSAIQEYSAVFDGTLYSEISILFRGRYAGSGTAVIRAYPNGDTATSDKAYLGYTQTSAGFTPQNTTASGFDLGVMTSTYITCHGHLELIVTPCTVSPARNAEIMAERSATATVPNTIYRYTYNWDVSTDISSMLIRSSAAGTIGVGSVIEIKGRLV